MAEVETLATILLFFSFFAVINTILPEEFQVVKPFDFAWFGGGVVGIGTACVVITGIPCAVAIGVFGFVSLFTYVVVLSDWIKLLIFTPIVIVIIYLMIRMAKGGG